MSKTAASVIGLDSAWTDNPKAPGAICILRLDEQGAWLHLEPKLVSFDQAAALINAERLEVDKCIVALDQPTIVPNGSGSRPVDKVAGAIISWVGGGVQPASRSKIGMFDDSAPIWRFKKQIDADDDPEAARAASRGVFLMEVFPALALVSIEPDYCQRLKAPKYNPANRGKFCLEHWKAVIETVRSFSAHKGLRDLEPLCAIMAAEPKPKKADQDKLDAIICGLIGLHWLQAPRSQSAVIGNMDTGYMVLPTPGGLHHRLLSAARKRDVPVA